MINGQSGKVAGKVPLSPWKVTLGIVALLALIAAIAYVIHTRKPDEPEPPPPPPILAEVMR